MVAGSSAVGSPLARYRAAVETQGMRPDGAQAEAAEALHALWQALGDPRAVRAKQGGLFGWLRGSVKPVEAPPGATGLYLYGGVGRGKTWLMDLFGVAMNARVSGSARRTHFHEFMLDVQAELKSLRDQPDPLPRVAERIAGEARVLCFDEFHVADIGDAMILAGLLEALLARGVALVATSNDPPAELYRDGLQRARFLPAIALIERRLVVMHLASETDYRLRTLSDAKLYITPDDAHAEAQLASSFARLAPLAEATPVRLSIGGRDVRARAAGEGVAWFDFEALCATPRSPADYLEIARCYQTVLLAGVPSLADAGADVALRFVHLVDVFYDQRVKLIVSAAVPVDALNPGDERLAARFRRTRSRLTEMRSLEYLGAAHRPGVETDLGPESPKV